MNFAHFCEFWCFSFGKQARFTLNFCSGMPVSKVHELTFLWFGLPGPLLIETGPIQFSHSCVWAHQLTEECESAAMRAGREAAMLAPLYPAYLFLCTTSRLRHKEHTVVHFPHKVAKSSFLGADLYMGTWQETSTFIHIIFP